MSESIFSLESDGDILAACRRRLQQSGRLLRALGGEEDTPSTAAAPEAAAAASLATGTASSTAAACDGAAMDARQRLRLGLDEYDTLPYVLDVGVRVEGRAAAPAQLLWFPATLKAVSMAATSLGGGSGELDETATYEVLFDDGTVEREVLRRYLRSPGVGQTRRDRRDRMRADVGGLGVVGARSDPDADPIAQILYLDRFACPAKALAALGDLDLDRVRRAKGLFDTLFADLPTAKGKEVAQAERRRLADMAQPPAAGGQQDGGVGSQDGGVPSRPAPTTSTSSLVYGEIEFASFAVTLQKVIHRFAAAPAAPLGGKRFYDIGSGTGKPVFAAALLQGGAAFSSVVHRVGAECSLCSTLPAAHAGCESAVPGWLAPPA
jgi:hypothetical protein